MPELARNPQTGEYRFLDQSGEWKPAEIARNPETGKRVVWNGADWQPIETTGPKQGYLKGLSNTVQNAFVLGLGDEAAGAGAATGAAVRSLLKGDISGLPKAMSEGFQRGAERIRGSEREFSRDYPVTSAVGQAGGTLAAFAPNAAAAGAGFAINAPQLPRLSAPLLRAMGPAQTTLGNVGRMAAAGAVEGGGYGALLGAANAEGGVGDRIEGGLTGGAIGAALGGTIPPLIEGGKAVGRMAGNLLGTRDPQTVAMEKLAQALRRDNVTPNQMAFGVAEANKAGVPLAPVDVGGRNMQRLGRSVETVPGAGSDRAAQFIDERQMAQGERLTQQLQAALGNKGEFYQAADDIIKARKEAADPLYKAAYAKNFTWPDGLEEILQRPALRTAEQRARIISANEGVSWKDIERGPNMQRLDWVKRGLDDVLEGYRDTTTGRLVLDESGRAIQKAKNQFVDLLDKANPTFAQARNAYKGPTDMLDAMADGRAFARGDLELITRKFADPKFTPGERDMFKIGAMRELRGMVEKGADGADKVRSLFGSPAKRERLRTLVGDDAAFESLAKSLGLESKAVRTARTVMGGSPTGRIAAEQDDLLGNSVLDFAQGNYMSGARGVASRYLTRARGINEPTAESLSSAMFNPDPSAAMALARALSQRQSGPTQIMNQRLVNLLRGASAEAGAASQGR